MTQCAAYGSKHYTSTKPDAAHVTAHFPLSVLVSWASIANCIVYDFDAIYRKSICTIISRFAWDRVDLFRKNGIVNKWPRALWPSPESSAARNPRHRLRDSKWSSGELPCSSPMVLHAAFVALLSIFPKSFCDLWPYPFPQDIYFPFSFPFLLGLRSEIAKPSVISVESPTCHCLIQINHIWSVLSDLNVLFQEGIMDRKYTWYAWMLLWL